MADFKLKELDESYFVLYPFFCMHSAYASLASCVTLEFAAPLMPNLDSAALIAEEVIPERLFDCPALSAGLVAAPWFAWAAP